MIIIEINCFVIIINFRNHFDKALLEIFQFCRALELSNFLSIKVRVFGAQKLSYTT